MARQAVKKKRSEEANYNTRRKTVSRQHMRKKKSMKRTEQRRGEELKKALRQEASRMQMTDE